MQSILDTIRQGAPNNLILVGTPIWSGDPGPCATDPLTGDNLVYVAHAYPANWNDWFTNQISKCAAAHPVFSTEWGFEAGSGFDPSGLKRKPRNRAPWRAIR